MNKYFPKVLLLCNFNQRTANGITIKNLFRYWPKDKIAVVDYTSSIEEMYSDNIDLYYKIGNKESKFIFPFSVLKKPSNSGSYNLSVAPEIVKSSKSKGKGLIFRMKLVLMQLQLIFLHKSGLSLISKKYFISSEFDTWFRNFNPDVVYTTVGDISNMEFVLMIKKKYKRKLIFHVFDDFVNSKHEQTLIKSYWKKRLYQTFRNLLAKTDLNLVISEKMAHEYSLKYNQEFHPFHNPVIEEIWVTTEQTVHKNNDKFTFVFTGAVIHHTASTLKLFIKSIQSLNNQGYSINLEIYTPTDYKEFVRLLGINAHDYYKGFISNNKIPAILKGADALLLALSFEKESVKYTKLSMATKATEYLVSGRPIMVFAPQELAVSEYLAKYQAAYVISEKQVNSIIDKIKSFIDNSELRNEIGKNGIQLANENHLSKRVTEKLYQLIKNL